jgi:hypothetical protein
MSKKICVLGAGESYIYSFFDLIGVSSDDFWVYLVPADFGGSSGLWNRLLEFNNGELNQKLHGKIIPNLTWGDFNKTIVFYLNQKHGSQIAATLDFRSNDLADLINEFDILADFLALEQDLEKKFYHYLITCFDYFTSHQKDLQFKSLKPLCLGYIWQTFLYFQLDLDTRNINKFYQNLNILPSNLNLNFTYSNRQTLLGQTESGKLLVGEDEIDLYQEPVLPQSLKLQNVDARENIFEPSLLIQIKHSDTIIIPPGSIANWLPLVNCPQIEDILVEKSKNEQLIWITNPFFEPNEYGISTYLDYLKSKNILPILLASSELDTQVNNTNLLHNLNLTHLTVETNLAMDVSGKIYSAKSLRFSLLQILEVE